MVWFKIDDGFWSHPKVIELSPDAGWLWARAGSYCANQLTDGKVSRAALRMLGATLDDHAVAELVDSGLWLMVTGGFQFHDWADYQPTKEQVMAERDGSKRRQAISRDVGLRDALKARDGDHCRYCAVEVKWTDRKGSTGATYDHVDPFGPDTFDNLVIACRGCNSRKGQRTPDQAGMTLLPPSTQIGSRSDSGARLGSESSPVPSRPVPGDSSKTSQSQSRNNRASDVTDSEEASPTITSMAAQLGITSLDAVMEHVYVNTGRRVTPAGAVGVARHLLSKAKNHPTAPQKYVMRAISMSPFEVQQYIDESGMAA